ncbi:MAG: glycosyltransferase family 39 protein [Desulforhopalus sp.]
MSRSEKGMFLLVIVIIMVFIGSLGLNRSFLTYATETDFLGGFLPEAERLLAGKPLLLEFHPPFYSIVLAGTQTLIGNWFKTGIILSLASCLIVLVSNFYLFEKSCGRFAGWATLAGFAISTPFLTFSCFATSDVFFLALYSLSLLVTFLAYEKNSKKLWSLGGLICGLALLTRSNSITLLALLLIPWLSIAPAKERWANFFSMVFGICVPLAGWIGFAIATGSSFAPAGNHANLALTYFSHGADRISGDARAPLEKEFTSLWQVVSHDPLHIVKTYVTDLFHNKTFKPNELLPFPVNYLAALSLLVMLFRKPASTFWYFLLMAAIFQLLLVNFKAYETRLYLFLLPIMTAPLGVILGQVSTVLARYLSRNVVIALFIVIIAWVGRESVEKSHFFLHREDKELSEVLQKAAAVVEKSGDTIIFSRKPHLAHYLGVGGVYLPRVSTVQELGDYLAENYTSRSLYVYYGPMEQHFRPQFRSLEDEDSRFFKVVAQSDKENFWTLFKYTGLDSKSE